MIDNIYTDEIPSFTIDNKKNVISCNDAFYNLTNYSNKDIINLNLKELSNLLRVNSPSFLTNVLPARIYYIFTKELAPVEISIKVIKNSDYLQYYFLENHLGWLAKKFDFIKQLYSNNKVGIALYSFNDLVLLASNQRFLNFLTEPFNKKQFCIGKHPRQILSIFPGSKLEKIVLNVITTCKTFHSKKYKILTSSGQYTYWDIFIDPIQEASNPMYILIVASNVTKRVESEQIINEQSKIIHQQRNELDTILKNTSAGISTVDKNGTHSRISSNTTNWYNLFELPPNSKTASSREYYSEDGFLISRGTLPISFFFDKKNSSTKQVLLKDGATEIYYLINWNPVLSKKGHFSIGIITTNDVTFEIEKQKQLENIMHMHEDFFSFIAHEFKTPITTINSTIQLLELVYSSQLTDKVKHSISTIKRNTYQQMRLVNNLLDITRAESGYLKIYKKNYDIVSMTKVIVNSIVPFAASKNINIKFYSEADSITLAVDDEKYERIILNILSNAIKFTQKNKSIYVTIYSDLDNVYVEIKDEGAGIPKEKLKVIFDRFGQVCNSYTRQNEGTGIGLCLVKLLLKAMDGDILLQSTEGVGSIFTIVLPNKITNEVNSVNLPDFTNDHLTKALNMEFSNIYFS